MKWRPSEPVEGDIYTEIPDKMIQWAKNNEMNVRGHALLWAKRKNNPDWVQNLYGEELKTAVFNRDFAQESIYLQKASFTSKKMGLQKSFLFA